MIQNTLPKKAGISFLKIIGGPMTTQKQYMDLYEGNGRTLKDRNRDMPGRESFEDMESPENYIASKGLRNAVNVALTLEQPLLVTGEPGTGKTRLANSVAWELGLKLLPFHTKTSSVAADLFYHYDGLRRFQDAQLKIDRPIEDYITCQALGTAVILSRPTDRGRSLLPDDLKKKSKDNGPMRSVVLIDEIDKAPRDMPNDVLNEIENMTFEIRETDWEPFAADMNHRPILILTSNSEKHLPDAFLRRCVFYHIEFPDADALKEIVTRRFSSHPEIKPALSEEFLDAAIRHFNAIRDLRLKKRPATSEFLAWVGMVKALDVKMVPKPEKTEKMEMTYSVLAKSREDLEAMKGYLRKD